MKTLTKILSVLIVVVMCVSLFGANAYAIDLFNDPQDAGGVDLFGEPAAEGGSDGSVDLFGEPEQPVQPAAPSQPQGGVDLQIGEFEGNDDLQMNAASGSVATVGKVACKDAGEINAALANGGSTVTVITGKTVSGEIIINRAATIDLNGGTISGTITVNSSLTIQDSSGGSGKVTGSINKMTGGTVNVTGGKFATAINVSQYVSTNYKVVDADGGTMHKVVKNEAEPLGSTIAVVGTIQFDSLDKLNEYLASNNVTVKLVKPISGDIKFLKGGVLDLNGQSVSGNVVVYGNVNFVDNSGSNSGSVNGNIVADGGSAVLYAGTYNPKPDVTLGKVKLASGYDFDSTNKVVPTSSTFVATVNGVGYDTLQKAYDAATGGDTIVVLEKTNTAADYTLSGPINKNVNFQLGSNGLGAVTINAAQVSFSGGTVAGITVSNGSVTLNGTNVTGALTLDKSTLNMSSGTVGSIASNNGSKLYVSGGKINGLTGSGDTTRAITGGSWNVGSGAMSYFEASIANGYEKKGTSAPYTVGPASGSGGGSGGGSGSSESGYIVSPTTYVKYSSGPVTVSMPHSDYIEFYYSLNSDGSGAYAIPNYSVSGSVVSLSTDWLNGLNNNTTYWLYVRRSSGAVRMGSVYITSNSGGGGGGSVIPGGTWRLEYVNGSKWYGGDDTLEFYSDLLVTGAAELPLVRIDTKSPPNKTISLEQYWENGTGYFKLGRNLMNTLSANEVYYIQVYDAAHPTQMTNILTFTLGPTLKPIDTDKHVINSTRNLKFLCSEQIARVYVGNIELTSDDDFALSNNRKTVTLSAEFLNKRTAGNTYTIKVLTYSGDYASCTFQILTTGQASSSPRTGDESNLGLWAAFLLLSGTAVVVLLPKLRKHEM